MLLSKGRKTVYTWTYSIRCIWFGKAENPKESEKTFCALTVHVNLMSTQSSGWAQRPTSSSSEMLIPYTVRRFIFNRNLHPRLAVSGLSLFLCSKFDDDDDVSFNSSQNLLPLSSLTSLDKKF